MRVQRSLLCLVLLAPVAALVLSQPAFANGYFSVTGLDAEQAGLAVFQEADRRASGYQDLAVDLDMVLRDQRGATSLRKLKMRQLEMSDDGDRLLVVFDAPKPIRGTALLSYAHKHSADDQWLYLPAMKRVKKIASQNRSGPFLSSEFAFEDLALQELERFRYRLLEAAPDSPEGYYRVERIPLDEHSGYSRQEVTLDAEEFRIQSIRYFDRRGRPLKTLEVDGYQRHEGRFWKPTRMLMSNQQTGKTTELIWRDYRFSLGLDADRDFSTNSLRRAR